MISPETLIRLVPKVGSEFDSWARARGIEGSADDPERRIGFWAANVRSAIQERWLEDGNLRRAMDISAFIGIGIFHAPESARTLVQGEFPVVDGYQFGILLFGPQSTGRDDGFQSSRISLGRERRSVPVHQLSARFFPQGSAVDGHVCAIYSGHDGEIYGITAAHVVKNHGIGQKVSINCSSCSSQAKLSEVAPGFIDAAAVHFPCHGPIDKYDPDSVIVRPVMEGETVDACFGESGRKRATVMMALQTPSQIKCAATPMHFLMDAHGFEGDSGSLISAESSTMDKQQLLGMYLGKARCEIGPQRYANYGYALDLAQAIGFFGCSQIISGEFNE